MFHVSEQPQALDAGGGGCAAQPLQVFSEGNFGNAAFMQGLDANLARIRGRLENLGQKRSENTQSEGSRSDEMDYTSGEEGETMDMEFFAGAAGGNRGGAGVAFREGFGDCSEEIRNPQQTSGESASEGEREREARAVLEGKNEQRERMIAEERQAAEKQESERLAAAPNFGETLGMSLGPVLPQKVFRQELLKSQTNGKMVWARKYQYLG